MTVAHQAPLSLGFPRQEYWSGLPFLTPGDLPDSGMEPSFPVFPALQVRSLPLSHLGSTSPGTSGQKRQPTFLHFFPKFGRFFAAEFCSDIERRATGSVRDVCEALEGHRAGDIEARLSKAKPYFTEASRICWPCDTTLPPAAVFP